MAKRNRSRRKPADPAANAEARERRAMEARAAERARAKDPSRWEEEKLTAERAEAFERQGVSYNTDLRGRLKNAHKADIFQSLYERGSISRDEHNAVRALQDLMIVRAGFERGGAMALERQDESGNARAEITDRMVDAGVEVDLTLRLVGPPSGAILAALLDPLASHVDADWRATIKRITGVDAREKQAVPLQIAAQALLGVRDDVADTMAPRRKQRSDQRRAAQNGQVAA